MPGAPVQPPPIPHGGSPRLAAPGVSATPTLPRRGVSARLAWAISFLWLSVGLHTLVLSCLAIFVAQADRDSTRLGLEAVLADEEGDEGFDKILDGPAVEVAQDTSAIDSQAAWVPEQSANATAALALGDLDRLGSGSGAREGEGGGGGVELKAGFFGSQSEGRSIVYVVDMSGSMRGRRFDRARSELVRSIAKLSAEQSFYVFFFNDRAYPLFDPLPAKGLLPATTGNKSRASRWIRAREPFSKTNPTLALQWALEMKPQVIYLLTDGELDYPDVVRRVIRDGNKSQTQIHTIAFENEEGARTLEAIAKENNGTFRFVR
jgi:hypothetical protein